MRIKKNTLAMERSVLYSQMGEKSCKIVPEIGWKTGQNVTAGSVAISKSVSKWRVFDRLCVRNVKKTTSKY
jgi:hypothetical protein